MACSIECKMHYLSFIILLIVNKSLSVAVENREDKSCDCYDTCSKNFTTNSIKDIQKIDACQRGCRFYSLVLHTTHESKIARDFVYAKEGCLLSCSGSYKVQFELSSCNFGCFAGEATRKMCNNVENPQINYSFLIEESDVLIHPGEPDPDDVLTDPGLRKQFEKTLEALLDTKPKLPEIHFRNLPIRNQKPLADYSHINFKCPKFYGFDSKFEIRNGKIIIGDLYLFVGVFIFVVICFLLGHHFETKNMTKQLAEAKIFKKGDYGNDGEPLLKSGLKNQCDLIIEKENFSDYIYQKSDILGPSGGGPETKFENITLVFHDENETKEIPLKENTDTIIKI